MWPENFHSAVLGQKPYEVRKNDRDFKIGDFLILEEWVPRPEDLMLQFRGTDSRYTGAFMLRSVVSVMPGGRFGVADDHIVMTVEPVTDEQRGTIYARTPLSFSGERRGGAEISGVAIAARYRELEPIPEGVYWCTEHGNFYDLEKRSGLGDTFFRKWHARREEFPASRCANAPAIEILGMLRQDRINAQESGRKPPVLPRLDELAKDWIKDSAMAFSTEVVTGPAPKQPPESVCSHHETELLMHLMQEASEVIKAATKVLLFGKRTIPPPGGLGYDNIGDLGLECGNLSHMIDVVEACNLIDHKVVQRGVNSKWKGLEAHLSKRP